MSNRRSYVNNNSCQKLSPVYHCKTGTSLPLQLYHHHNLSPYQLKSTTIRFYHHSTITSLPLKICRYQSAITSRCHQSVNNTHYHQSATNRRYHQAATRGYRSVYHYQIQIFSPDFWSGPGQAISQSTTTRSSRPTSGPGQAISHSTTTRSSHPTSGPGQAISQSKSTTTRSFRPASGPDRRTERCGCGTSGSSR